MLQNFPKIRVWQITLVLILVTVIFIGDWIDLMFHSFRTADGDLFVSNTVSTVLNYEVPPPGSARTEIEHRFGAGQEAIPGTSAKNQPTDLVYPLGSGTELRVSYDYAGIAKNCALFYQNQGVYLQAEPTSTAPEAYMALTGLVRLQMFMLLLHPYAIIAMLTIACLFMISLTPPVQRFLNRNKKDEVPEWMKALPAPNPAKAQPKR